MCCTGAHLLPKTGKESVLPATATAHSSPATAIFSSLIFFFILQTPLKGFPEKRQLQRRFPIRPADVPPSDGSAGRAFLVSSHAGTRLPIAASYRAQGAPPLPL